MQDNFKEEVIIRLTKIETKLDDYKSIQAKSDEAFNKSMQNEKDIAQIKSNTQWLWRTIVGLLIAGVIGAIITFK